MKSWTFSSIHSNRCIKYKKINTTTPSTTTKHVQDFVKKYLLKIKTLAFSSKRNTLQKLNLSRSKQKNNRTTTTTNRTKKKLKLVWGRRKKKDWRRRIRNTKEEKKKLPRRSWLTWRRRSYRLPCNFTKRKKITE